MKSDLPALMKDRNLDALLVLGDALHNSPMVYFTGVVHVTEALLVIKRGEDPVLFCHNMERGEAAATGFAIRSLSNYDFRHLIQECNGDHGKARAIMFQRMLTDAGLTKGRVAIYGQQQANAVLDLFNKLKELLPEIEFIGETDHPVVLTARVTKDPEEAQRQRQVQKAATEIVAQVADFLSHQKAKDGVLVDKDGQPVTVGRVKSKINQWVAERGLENPDGIIFAPGAEGAVPHNLGQPDTLLRLGEPIVFDFFPEEAGGGFWADFTRTWCLDHASDGAQALYEDVRTAYETVIGELKAGELCTKFQERTCEIFKQRGHPVVNDDATITSGYVHSLAHGLGLDVHEPPGFYPGSKDILQTGEIITIEPGLYYPERGLGMRIEDAVYIRPEDGLPQIQAEYPLDLVLPLK